MNERTLNVNFNFLENCNYNSSNIQREIVIPLQTPTVTVRIKNEGLIYYNDIVELEATIEYNDQPVSGYVNFFYMNDGDIQEYKINDDAVPIDQYGNARIRFTPTKNCIIKASYIGSTYFESAESDYSNSIILNKIPTKIEFKSIPPYFVDPKDDVQLKVTVNDVRDRNNPVPVEYGVVTFLHYDTFDIDLPVDGQEHVIGNPVYLINGEASIKYSPVQNESESDSIYNIELIRAVYNYDNSLYGVNWKYYQMHSAYISIARLHPNNININIGKEEDGEIVQLPNDDGVFIATNEDVIVVTFEIPEYHFSNDSCIQVYIQGEERPRYAYYDGEYFKCYINNLKNGIYSVYGIVIDANNTYLKTTDGTPITITNEVGQDYTIENQIYLQAMESQRLYFQIATKQDDYTIEFEDSDYVIIDNNALSIKVLLSATTDEEVFNLLLKNEKCYFYCTTLGQTYESIIKEENGQLYAELDIIEEVSYLDENDEEQTRLQYNIPMQTMNDYIFYAYIQTKEYNKEYNGETITRQYQKINTDLLTIKVRDNFNLVLDVKVRHSTYPGQIKYEIAGANFFRDNIYVDLKEGNNIIKSSLFMNQQNNIIAGYIDNIQCGEHTLQAHTHAPYSFRTNTETYSIGKATLNASLNYYNYEVNVGRNISIIFGLEEETNAPIDLNDIDINDFNISITKDSIVNNQMIVRELRNMTDNYINIICDANVCDDGEWSIDFDYAGNEYYMPFSQSFSIAAYRYPALFDYTMAINTGSVVCHISFEENQHNNEYVLVLGSFTDENDIIDIVNITDSMGTCSFSKLSSQSTLDWQQYDDFEIAIDPKGGLLALWQTCTDVEDAKDKFEDYFDDYNIQCSEGDIENLYYQFKNNYELCLFTGYEATSDTYKQSNI